ncbi:hypothetical protein [Limnohabitans sp. 15K]|uniref:hypothetical protein n=1 Tax=Limnohabitans sp. 15K TaxID=1100706 RepID=UPI001179B7D3|nr:hypothetical protein [Limnohabitans sp. 15K]
MKKAIWKLLFTCLMLIAIPVQGFAGAFAAVCEGNHQALYGVADSMASDEAHSHTAIEPVSQSMVALADQFPGQHDSAADQNDHLPTNDGAHLKCSACGPCCIGAALVSSFEPVVAQFDGKFQSPEISSHHLSPALAGLDRPPQELLA